MQGCVTLVVFGENLNFGLISNLIGLRPDRIIGNCETR